MKDIRVLLGLITGDNPQIFNHCYSQPYLSRWGRKGEREERSSCGSCSRGLWPLFTLKRQAGIQVCKLETGCTGKRKSKAQGCHLGKISQGRKKDVEGCDGEAARECVHSDPDRWNSNLMKS